MEYVCEPLQPRGKPRIADMEVDFEAVLSRNRGPGPFRQPEQSFAAIRHLVSVPAATDHLDADQWIALCEAQQCLIIGVQPSLSDVHTSPSIVPERRDHRSQSVLPAEAWSGVIEQQEQPHQLRTESGAVVRSQ